MTNEMAKANGGQASPFERIRRTNEANNEYWESRALAEILEYTQYRNFEAVVGKAKLACFNSGHRIEDHFADVSKMIEVGKGGKREISVTLLSRYACYLVIQNADPNKEIVAQGQTYFAIQTRRQEMADERIEDDRPVELEDPSTLRNLSELAATKTLFETFKKAINALTVRDKGDAEIRDTIKLRQTRPFVAKNQGYLVPKKSVFNRIIGDSNLELRFAAFLENCSDDEVVSYAKNYPSVHFKLDYVNADGDISNYYPDFMVKLSGKRLVIVETKGQADLDVPLKMARLRQWCEDINRVQKDVAYDFVYVDEESFEKYKPTSFRQLLEGFKEYKT